MKYFLFNKHPLRDDLESLGDERVETLKRYFRSRPTLEIPKELEGRSYNLVIDYELFGNYANFDCFNCTQGCCGDNPATFTDKTKDYMKSHIDKYHKELLKDSIIDDDIENLKISMENNNLLLDSDTLRRKKSCSCGYKVDGKTLCLIHSIALEEGKSSKEIIDLKPFICNMWPVELIVDGSTIYITLPDDFTNLFTIEDFDKIPCINLDYSESDEFRKINPDGFLEDDYKPFIYEYRETIINTLGVGVYEAILKRLVDEDIIDSFEGVEVVEQIYKKI